MYRGYDVGVVSRVWENNMRGEFQKNGGARWFYILFEGPYIYIYIYFFTNLIYP